MVKSASLFGLDKLLHALAYCLLTLGCALWVRATWWHKHPWLTRGLLAAVVLGYAAIDEVHQLFVPGRSASILDWLADALGAAVAIGIIEFVRALKRRGVISLL